MKRIILVCAALAASSGLLLVGIVVGADNVKPAPAPTVTVTCTPVPDDTDVPLPPGAVACGG